MAGYTIRSLKDLAAEARAFFTGAIEGAVASVWPNTFTVFGKVLGLLNFEHELRRRWLFKQIFASSADEMWLARHGFELGLSPAPGLPALGAVAVAASPGLIVPAGLVFVRADGATYTTIMETSAAAASVTLYLEADAVGTAGNTAVGETLSLSIDTPAPTGLGETATVLDAGDGTGLSNGVDPEPVEAFRARVLARKRNPPQGGSEADYRAWTYEALPGVVRAVWVDSFSNDARTVWVMFTVVDQPNGIPTAGQVATVQAYLDDPLRRPVTARVEVAAPVPSPVLVLIGGLAPDTPDIRDSIAAEIAAAFIDRAEPGKPTRGPFLLSRSWLDEAVSRATGEDRHRLIAPAADGVFGAGVLPVPGTISYTD